MRSLVGAGKNALHVGRGAWSGNVVLLVHRAVGQTPKGAARAGPDPQGRQANRAGSLRQVEGRSDER